MKFKLFLLLLVTVSAFSQQKIEVFFDFNEDMPNENSVVMLQKWMKENPKVEILKLSGYCDSVDVSSYNKKLSARRINTVFAILKDNENIIISEKCMLEPIGKDFKQSKIQAENRKVVIYYQKGKEEALTTQVKKSKKGDLIKLSNIYFLNNSDQIVPKSEPTLQELLTVMKDNPKLKIEIQGHICCKKITDPDEVSPARAKAIYDFLIQNKIDKKRLSYKGFGATKPIHPIPEKNTQEADENRRVEIMIVEN